MNTSSWIEQHRKRKRPVSELYRMNLLTGFSVLKKTCMPIASNQSERHADSLGQSERQGQFISLTDNFEDWVLKLKCTGKPATHVSEILPQ
jgi:hypothetical protein